jgi:hypothetical protein
MKPRKNYRQRPKKSGSKKRYRVSNQRKRLVAAGLDEEFVKHLTERQIREQLMRVSRKKAKKKEAKKPAKKAKKAKKPAKKKTSKKTEKK